MFPTISIPDRRLVIAVSILLVAGIFPGILFGENHPGSLLSAQPPYQSPDNSATPPVSSPAPRSGAEIPCLTGLCGSYVQALCVYNGDLYAGGAFWKADGKPVRNIARWDGSQWHDIGGANNEVQALIVYDGKLIAGGRFDSLGGVAASRVAAWDGTSWSPLGRGIIGRAWRFVSDFAVHDGKLVAGGEFDSAGTVRAPLVAAWDGATWAALNAGLPAQVTAVEIYNSELYAAGFFPARLAKWNGASWADVYAPASNYFYCLGVYDNRLIAAGYFPTMGDDTVNNIAAWDGVAWHSLGTGFTLYGSGQNADIRTVFAYDGQLIAGGQFDIAGGDSVSGIAAWNGAAWNALGDKLNQHDYYVSVYGLTEYAGDLIVGGTFSGAGAIIANNIARWDGASWHAVTATDGMPFAIQAATRWVIEDDSVTVPISKMAGSENAYGFDFLIDFDDTYMDFVEAVPGALFDQPGAYEWEYFNYRSDPGSVRVVGVAEANNDGHHPTTSIADGTELFSLIFQGTALSPGEMEWAPLQFRWNDCGDNAIAIDSATGDLVISRYVYDANLQDITDTAATFPTFGGAPQECLNMTGDSSRFIDYYDGMVYVVDSQQIDYRGDININGIANEIADWVMFINYFMEGLEAFNTHVEGSVAASDVNADGVTLHMEDLVFLQRVICGDTLPVPADKGFARAAESVIVIQDITTKTVSVAYDDTLAGMFILVDGEITPAFLLDTARHICGYAYDGAYTRIIILPMLGGAAEYCTEGFTEGPLFTYTGTGLVVQLEDTAYDFIWAAPQAADFNNNLFNRNYVQIVGVDGQVEPESDSIPMSLARSSPFNTITFYVGDFAGHTANDVDLSTVRFNGTIGYSGVDILPSYPGFTGPVIRLKTNARELITSYGSMDSLRSVYVSLSGEFTDQQTFLALTKLVLFPEPTTLVVPSAWSSIRGATGSAIDGDTVLVEPGTYTGILNRSIYVYSDFIMRSTAGPDSTIVDCEWMWFMQAFDSLPGKIVIDGFTVTNSYDPGDAAIDFVGKSLDIRNCVFINNAGDSTGGAISVIDGSLSVDRCVFSHNRAQTGAAIVHGGISNLIDVPTRIINSTFYRNTADSITPGAIIHVYNSTVYPTLRNNIIAFNRSNQTIRCDGEIPSDMAYNDIYGNSGGDWTGPLAMMLGQFCNISEDPLFCDTGAADFYLDGLSPCLVVNNECGQLMGAYGMGCGFVCGDINTDLTINIADAVYVIAYIFRGGPPPENFIAADLNANGELDVADAVIIINYIFRSGPHPDCQSD